MRELADKIKFCEHFARSGFFLTPFIGYDSATTSIIHGRIFLLSQELAAPREAENKLLIVLDELGPFLQSVVPEEFIDPAALMTREAALRQSFNDDYDRAVAIADILYGDDIAAYGAQMDKVFSDWETQGGGPSLLALIWQAIGHFDLDPAKPLVKAALLSAVLAEYPNDLPYHGNEHYRKVLCHGIRLMATHNKLHGGTNRMLTNIHIAKLLTASCIHDLGHIGGDNLKEGMYTPGFMEQRAFDIARPYFEALGLDNDDFRDIETLVFCTDITFFAGDNSPCVRMKKIYKYYFWDDRNEDVSMMMMGKLRRFEDNPRMALMAMLLHEADIATSAGISYERTVTETLSIMGERGVTTAGPRTILAFLREQLGETLFTEAGKQIFGPVMNSVISRAEQEMESGIETFPGQA